jgi:DNA-binding HxlR family transcriptional regulator
MKTALENGKTPRPLSCPADGFQQMINGKYKLRIIWALQRSPRRYGEIKKGLLQDAAGDKEIAPRVLSRELKTLAAFGLIERTDFHVVPPKVEYNLTPVGRRLLPIIAQMIKFGKQYLVGRFPASRPGQALRPSPDASRQIRPLPP